jgi:hypothetical protein
MMPKTPIAASRNKKSLVAAGGVLQAATGSTEKIAAADRKRAEALLLLIERRKARIAEDFYDLGEALKEIQHRKLHLALGHASFADLLRARGIMGLSQAKKLIEVVSTLPRDQALKLGAEKAYALARYTAATPELDTPQSLLDQGAKIGGKPIAEISVRDLAVATGKVRAKTGKATPKSDGEREAEQAARKVQAWLRKGGAKGATAEAQKVKGAWWVRLELPADAATRLLRDE